jgi:glucose-1-phosphate cytidylyltransferase
MDVSDKSDTSGMEVVVFCGGLGTRLREETEFKPKPMVKIGEHPILWHVMKHYAHFGHKRFVLALGYRGEYIKEYFYNYHLQTHDFTIQLGDGGGAVAIHDRAGTEDWRVTCIDTGPNTLKGGRLKRVAPFVKGDLFLCTYGDGVANVDLDDLVAFHKSHGKMATVTGVIPSMRFGEVRSNTDGTVDFAEKRHTGEAAMVNGGYYVLSREIFEYLTDDDKQDFEMGPLEQVAKQGELMMYRHEDFWHCMDNVRDMNALARMWEDGSAPWKLWR